MMQTLKKGIYLGNIIIFGALVYGGVWLINIMTADFGKPKSKKQINYKVQRQRINNDRNDNNNNLCRIHKLYVETRPRQVGRIMSGNEIIILNPNLYWVMALTLGIYIVVKWR